MQIRPFLPAPPLPPTPAYRPPGAASGSFGFPRSPSARPPLVPRTPLRAVAGARGDEPPFARRSVAAVPGGAGPEQGPAGWAVPCPRLLLAVVTAAVVKALGAFGGALRRARGVKVRWVQCPPSLPPVGG